MKYLNYIINDKPINPDQIGAIGIPVAVVALPVMTVLLFGAGLMDGLRYHKLRYHRRQRVLRKKRYARHVILSLGHEVTRDKVMMLIAA